MMDEQAKVEGDTRELSDVELMTEFVRFFGVSRALQLLGWVALWGFSGVDDIHEYRRWLEAQGWHQRSAYRAARDFREFSIQVAELEGREVSEATQQEILRERARRLAKQGGWSAEQLEGLSPAA